MPIVMIIKLMSLLSILKNDNNYLTLINYNFFSILNMG